MVDKLLTPEEVIRLRIAIRERRRTHVLADASGAPREGGALPATQTTIEELHDSDDQSAKGSPAEDGSPDLDGLTATQLKDILTSRGIPIPHNSNKADLRKIIRQSEG